MQRYFWIAILSLLTLPATAGTRVPLHNNGKPAPASDLNPDWCAKAISYSRAHGGNAVRIEQYGQVVAEDYAPGFSADTPEKIYSGTKSFFAVEAMILEQKGVLRLDEKASDTLTEWKGDARKSITIDQLLSQTSGLSPKGERIYAARDQLAAAVRQPLVDPPGTRFHYGAAGYQAFGEILRRKFAARGKSVETVMTETLLEPYDLEVAFWKRDDAGNVLIHAGMQMTAEEWAKFGNLLTSAAPGPDALGFAEMFRGHTANPAYGLGFWLNAPQPRRLRQPMKDLLVASDGDQLYPGGPADLITAMGTGKQRLYVIPSRHLVVVRFAHSAPFSDGDFLSRLLTGKPKPDAHTH